MCLKFEDGMFAVYARPHACAARTISGEVSVWTVQRAGGGYLWALADDPAASTLDAAA